MVTGAQLKEETHMWLIRVLLPIVSTVGTYWFMWVSGLGMLSDLLSNRWGISSGWAVFILIASLYGVFLPNYFLMRKCWLRKPKKFPYNHQWEDRGYRDPQFPTSRP